MVVLDYGSRQFEFNTGKQYRVSGYAATLWASAVNGRYYFTARKVGDWTLLWYTSDLQDLAQQVTSN